jgi:NTP pyrophosphatase (non-canonical NTP hydrolase)
MFLTFLGMQKAIVAHRDCYGENGGSRCSDQLIEEMAELTVEIQHAKRGRKADIEGEIADVLVTIEVLCDALGIKKTHIWALAATKSDRLRHRIENFGSVNDPEQETEHDDKGDVP